MRDHDKTTTDNESKDITNLQAITHIVRNAFDRRVEESVSIDYCNDYILVYHNEELSRALQVRFNAPEGHYEIIPVDEENNRKTTEPYIAHDANDIVNAVIEEIESNELSAKLESVGVDTDVSAERIREAIESVDVDLIQSVHRNEERGLYWSVETESGFTYGIARDRDGRGFALFDGTREIGTAKRFRDALLFVDTYAANDPSERASEWMQEGFDDIADELRER